MGRVGCSHNHQINQIAQNPDTCDFEQSIETAALILEAECDRLDKLRFGLRRKLCKYSLTDGAHEFFHQRQIQG